MNSLCKLAALGAALGLAVAAGPAMAHHSFAMFDTNKPSVLKGTVKDLLWNNPHVSLLVMAEPKAGQTVGDVWNFETTSPGNLTRAGWTKRTFQPGDKIEVDYFPLRNGQHGGAFTKGTLTATGKVITTRQTPVAPPPAAK